MAQQMGTTLPPAIMNGAETLATINERFRAIYAEARAESIAKSRPVIIMFADRIELIDQDRREQCNIIPERYTVLKMVDHIPLTLYSMFANHADSDLSAAKLKQLAEIRTLTQRARSSFDKLALTKETLGRQYEIVDSSLRFMDDALKRRRVSESELTRFCRMQAALLLENAFEAISEQLSSIDTQVTLWRSQLGAEKWNKIKVVIAGGHMPREKHSAFQYFSKLLGEKREGGRIIYCEGCEEEADALNLLGTHVLDEGIAVSFFKDKWRMHRDFLSDGAERYLRQHPPGRSGASKRD